MPPPASLLLLPLLALGVTPAALAATPDVVLEGEVPEAGRFFDLPFEVPPGTVELEVRHDDLSAENILDWGLEDPERFRGYGGGNEEPAVVGVEAASRSYLAGPLPAGTWRVTVGKAKVVKTPARYRIEVYFRQQATLPPQPERRAYAPASPLKAQARWYAGDFHVHSRESGDAAPPLDEIARYARGRGLDFVHLSDHNTTSTLDFLVDAQARHPELLLVPGVEYTTYLGHANAIGATAYVSPRVGEEGGPTLDAALEAFAAQGALVSVNHPVYDVGDMCIGCTWKQGVPRGRVAAVEIATGGYDKLGRFFDEGAIVWWEWLLAQGHHVAALGGSDDHRAGVDLNLTQSAIAEPTTRVFATELSVQALLEGVRNGRTVVQLAGPQDPMAWVEASVPLSGDTVLAERATLSMTVTGARGQQVRWVHNGVRGPLVDVDRDDFVLTREVVAPQEGEDRYRAEVWVDGQVRTVTSHVWVARSADARGRPAPPPEAPEAERLTCGAGPAAFSAAALALGLLSLLRRKTRR